jgi:methyl-accepting chemotaxis protein PixJ
MTFTPSKPQLESNRSDRQYPEASLNDLSELTTSPSSPLPEARPNKFRTLVTSRLVETIALLATASLITIGASAWNIWSVYQTFKTNEAKQFRLQELSGNIVHFDEVLTMSARMAASTGDLKWEKRYRQFEPDLDRSIKEVIQLSPTAKEDISKTDESNLKLVDFENRAFDLVRQGKREEALNLLLGTTYDIQKQIYAKGIQTTLVNLKNTTDIQLQQYEQNLLWAVAFAGVSVPFLLACWIAILLIIRAYINERNQAQSGLLSSQASLVAINQDLEARTQQLSRQEQVTALESSVLQEDVGHILDVVAAVEEGDLTVEAEVSDRATGLVADTLNRLIEELAKTMGVVLATSQQIDRSADDLKQLAASAAQQVELQTQSVVQAQALMSNVNEISQDTAEQALQSNTAIQAAQAAVSQGQQEIAAMNKGVVSLQEGAEQIVKRAQSLAEFVSSAAQFTNDQKRVASLTRVLALNASMIAARASAQQDPEQFASVAKEFETIANQVNELAVQTNQSLVLLQQRTDRIQTVVSGVDDDVQEITGLVADFTQGVERSRQVLNNIQAVTEQVAQTGAQVTQSSQAIAEAARNTLGKIDNIASVATQTEQQSRFTRDRAEGMDRLARVLLETVQFFRLPSNLQEDETVAKALSFSTDDDTEPDLVKIS